MLNVSDIKLSVIIPAYNEELRLPKTLAQSIDYLQSQIYRSEIIVVNDGSTDATERIVRQQSSATVPFIRMELITARAHRLNAE
jgi:dolichyl-phosphate beta-glucosyltransferase